MIPSSLVWTLYDYRNEVEFVFSSNKLFYTALVDHTVDSSTVTATPNDSNATVDILSASDIAATSLSASRSPQVTLKEGYNITTIDVTTENGNV